jgi:hypothetical protein
MRNILKSVCVLLVLSACEAQPEDSTGSSPCVEKMKAGKS